MDILSKIKRLALSRRIVFTCKAQDEMYLDGLTEDEVVESIVSADRIDKVIRSTSPRRGAQKELLYILKGLTFSNVLVYTKGKIVKNKETESELLYILISSKRAE